MCIRDSHNYGGEQFGVARDEGTFAAGDHVGWPDALSSAYYLAEVPASTLNAPTRLAPPVERNGGTTLLGSEAGLREIPLLLTTGSALAPEVDAYLQGLYPPSLASGIKTATNAGGSNDGGFGYLFGGSAAVSPANLAQVGLDLSGGTYVMANSTDLAPTLSAANVFYTGADLTPVSSDVTAPAGVAAAPNKVCAFRNAFAGSQFAVAMNHDFTFTSATQQTQQIAYTAASSAFPASQSGITCVAALDTTMSALFFGSSLSGHTTPAVPIDYTAAHTMSGQSLGTLSAPSANAGDITAPLPAGQASEAQTITWTGVTFPITFQGTTMALATANITLVLTRTKGANSLDYVTFTGSVKVTSGSTTVVLATITGGESSATVAAGASTSSPFPLIGEYVAPGAGAFVATVTAGATPSLLNPTINGNS